ncbi:S1C family serine protease [Streptomyces capitiformicae]|uniref:Protease n=1 Tax=Streptomyces capitiformicae TaxID=2014920 RepID=A0A919GR99_9ACTN|nr:trypsin-like peptidase domain-containing protein [Streptomyces capitiformicae]GHH89371.1 protease [Streptomyces capitiformicae]
MGDHTGPTGGDGVAADAVRGESDGGDFELERPATVPAPGGAGPDDDFELARPASSLTPNGSERLVHSGPGDSASGADAGGDFELRPAAGGAGTGAVAASIEGAPGEVAAPPGLEQSNSSVGEESSPAADEVTMSGEATTRLSLTKSASVHGDTVQDTAAQGAGAPGGQSGALGGPGAPSERPKPLHDPDPYSTPPYGEPGPWAPAPPVQHPATTPAHGTNVQATAPAHGEPHPTAPQTHGVPAPATPQPPVVPAPVAPPSHDTATAAAPPPSAAAPSPSHGTSPVSAAPAAHLPPAPSANGTHASSAIPSPSPVTQAHGTSVPPTAPQPATGPYTDAPQPAAATPYPDASQAAPPSYPSPSPQPPYADASRAVPQAAPNPWQNYDPWAGSAPLQQNGAAVVSEEARRKRGLKILVVGAALIALVSGGVGGAMGAYLERNGGVGEVELPQSGGGGTGRAPDSVAGIAASALPSVVTLHVSGSDAQGTGTGFVLDKRGHILTNNHVVEAAATSGEISVTFSGGDTAEATIVGRDTGYDLAVVKVTGVNGLKPLPLGNSDEVQVGDPVVAIGAPFNLANTVTSGIISAKERPITAGGESGDASDVSYVDALQTDAPINPGNSGGPLVDVNARVIGINSAIRSAGSGSESDGGQAGSIGLGFAIPINQGKRVAEELINTGKATHPVIGVTLDMDYSGDGARIGNDDGGAAVNAGGPADRAGIRSGDVITEVDGQRVHSGDELIVKVRAHRPGDRLELTLQRDGREQKVSLTLGSSDGD